jgi:hypothetical protein
MTIGKEKKPSIPTAASRQTQDLRWWLLSAALVILASFWLFLAYYSWQEYSQHWDIQPVKVIISSPQYLSAGEEEEIRIAVENDRDSTVQAVFKLTNSGQRLNFLEHEGSNVFYRGDIQSQEQVTRKLKVFFPFGFGNGQANNVLGQPAGLSLGGSIDSQAPQLVADLPVKIAPFPKAKTWVNQIGIMLAGLVIWLFRELWDQTKKTSGTTE